VRVGHAGQSGHHGAQERGEPGHEHGHPAPAVQLVGDAVDQPATPAQQGQVEQAGAPPLTDQVTDRVAGNGAQHDDHDENDDVDVAARGNHAPENNGRLTRKDEADEDRRFGEDKGADQGISLQSVQVPDRSSSRRIMVRRLGSARDHRPLGMAAKRSS
jgi:hypothetical protein